ncbi:MAG: pyridoxal-phosphate dependent enzyme [Bacteroidales bacterium]|nr:pyridoxal-phosphate dependent enzyme [Bacteroidales bacterium]
MITPTKKSIEQAHIRIEKHIHRTPIMSSQQLDKLFACNMFFKCENFQKVGAFKSRGAVNAVFSLDEKQLQNGVCTHSSGNHAQALSRAAQIKNVAAYIVMPKNAPKVKVNAVKDYGGIIHFCEANLEARESELKKVISKTKATEIHPYDNYKIIEGQATATKELLSDLDNLDYIIAPVGGGGLLAGTALANHYFGNNAKVIAAEPKNADDAFHSFKAGYIIPSEDPNTIADGLLTSLGERNFPIIREHVSQIITVNERSIKTAMHLIWERMKIIIEPSSAVVLAAIIENQEFFKNKKIALILSGGNVDLENIHEILF